METLKARMIPINVRVKNGSYKVINYYSDEVKPPFSKHGGDEEGGEGDDGLAKQKIKTVQTESIPYKLVQLLLKCIANKGDVRSRKEEKYLMKDVDLALESGKMYLVL